MKPIKRKSIRLKNLEVGTPFVFATPGTLDVFRNLTLLSASDSRCVIEGFKYDGKIDDGSGGKDSGWKAFKDSCAPNAEVFIDPTRGQVQVGRYKDGTPFKKATEVLDTEDNTCLNKKTKKKKENNKMSEQIEQTEQTKPKRGRGRKPGAPKIAFPADRAFTSSEIVEETGFKVYVVSNELNKALKEGRIVETGDRISSDKGRGRRCKVFKVAQ